MTDPVEMVLQYNAAFLPSIHQVASGASVQVKWAVSERNRAVAEAGETGRKWIWDGFSSSIFTQKDKWGGEKQTTMWRKTGSDGRNGKSQLKRTLWWIWKLKMCLVSWRSRTRSEEWTVGQDRLGFSFCLRKRAGDLQEMLLCLFVSPQDWRETSCMQGRKGVCWQ